MKIKVKIEEWKGPFHSEKTGREYWRCDVELPDDGGQWSTCRWSIMTGHPTPPGPQEALVSVYDRRKGEGVANV